MWNLNCQFSTNCAHESFEIIERYIMQKIQIVKKDNRRNLSKQCKVQRHNFRSKKCRMTEEHRELRLSFFYEFFDILKMLTLPTATNVPKISKMRPMCSKNATYYEIASIAHLHSWIELLLHPFTFSRKKGIFQTTLSSSFLLLGGCYSFL